MSLCTALRPCLNPFEIRAGLRATGATGVTGVTGLNPFEIRAGLRGYGGDTPHCGLGVLIPLRSGQDYEHIHVL